MCKDKKTTKEGGNMPAILVDKERLDYLNGMKEYVNKFKRMSEDEAKKTAKERLIRSGILNENGSFTNPYREDREI